ncbi:WD40 repeat domain-containing serine/threonine protein kinase [Yinghuangia aomiensis]|uniref:WD40 repeat domain-containing serine/threonine protein kinase n=1 Tax=Yinghuangia aomiensis TaxID=676205 RepID=UPI0031F197D2
MQGQIFGGRYRLVGLLGEGGMGQVWEAQDETLDRPVAVKVVSLLAGGGSRGDEARARFLREARITAKLQHPAIVTIHDLGETDTGTDKVPFLVMELVRGEGLDATLRRGPVPLPDAARWGAHIADALTEAHDAGIMHRDIKPSNILITPSGTVKVLDFGIARAADPPVATADRLTQTGFIVGTPQYMAPEQARGFPEPRSDLYALGCLLFELITGRLPFQAPDAVGHLTAHLTEEPPAPSSMAPGIPPAWDDLVLTLLRKAPDRRYPDASALAQALRRLDRPAEPASPADAPTRTLAAPGTSPPPPRAAAPGRSNASTGVRRRTLVIGGLAVLGAAAGATAALWPDKHPDPDRFTSRGTTSVAFSPDGKTLATIGTAGVDAALWDVAGRKAITDLASGSGISTVAFSPDGKTLATAQVYGELQLRDTATGVVTAQLESGYYVQVVAFSPDGSTLILSGGSRPWLGLWNPVTPKPTAITDIAHGTTVLALSPDGKTLVSGNSDESTSAGLWVSDAITPGDSRTSEDPPLHERRLIQDYTNAVAFNPDGKTFASGGQGGLRLWNTAPDHTVTAITADPTSALAFSPDGKTLATAGKDGIRLWDTATHQATATLATGAFAAVAFSPDGRAVAGGNDDGCWLWNLR